MQHSVRELRAIGIQPERAALPHRPLPLARHQGQARALLRRAGGGGHHRQGRGLDLRGAARALRRGARRDRPEGAGPRQPRPRHGRLGAAGRSAIKNPKGEVTIGIVGKYVSFEDSYKSLNEALSPRRLRATTCGWCGAGWRRRTWRRATRTRKLAGVDGILVPGGFGTRGTGGMVAAAEYARRTGTPYFGICYGFQWAVTSSTRATCAASRAPTPPRSTRTPSTRSSTSCRTCWASRTWAAPCASARTPASSRPARAPRASTARPRSASATATATSSTRSYEGCLDRRRACVISGKTPDGKFVEIAEMPGPSLVHRGAVPSRVQVASRSRRTRCSPTSCARASRTGRRARRGAAGLAASRSRASLKRRRPALGRVWRASRGGGPLFLIAGPCVIESPTPSRARSRRGSRRSRASSASRSCSRPATTRRTARASAPTAGPGMERGLEILAGVRERTACPSSPTSTRWRRSSAAAAGGGRAADPRLPLPPDRPRAGGGAHRARS